MTTKMQLFEKCCISPPKLTLDSNATILPTTLIPPKTFHAFLPSFLDPNFGSLLQFPDICTEVDEVCWGNSGMVRTNENSNPSNQGRYGCCMKGSLFFAISKRSTPYPNPIGILILYLSKNSQLCE